jgi:hypothetical protein
MMPSYDVVRDYMCECNCTECCERVRISDAEFLDAQSRLRPGILFMRAPNCPDRPRGIEVYRCEKYSIWRL